MGKVKCVRNISLGLFVCLFILFPNPSVNAVNDKNCDRNKTKIIFVRGSGESVNGTTKQAVGQWLAQNLSTDSYDYYELSKPLVGAESEVDYRAVSVGGSLDGAKNGAEAIFSMSSIGEYRESVNEGKSLLKTHITNGLTDNQCLVLIGYSQGAQVIGEVLSEDNESIKSRILYVGLIGDPKNDTYGYGLLPGQNVPWYRGTAIVGVQGGILGRRWPNYVPRDVTDNQKTFTPTSSWCLIDDPVCSSNFAPGILSGSHSKYTIDAIPQMAIEIASVINNPSGTVTGNTPTPTCGAAKQDLVILLDTSPLMRRDANLFTDTPFLLDKRTTLAGVPLPPRTAGQIFTQLGCGDTKIAVVGYGRPQDGPPRLLLDFTKDAGAYDTLMASLYAPTPTGTYERTQFREGALAALDSNWRPDARRAIFALTDIPGTGPPPHWSGSVGPIEKDPVTQQVIGKAREKDVIMLGQHVYHSSYAGFTQVTNEYVGSLYSYLQLFGRHTGGYNWMKYAGSTNAPSFKLLSLESSLNAMLGYGAKVTATVTPIRSKVGQPTRVKLMDTVSTLTAAKLRGEGISYQWYVDCGDKTFSQYTSSAEYTFTATKAQKCTGSVIVKVIKYNPNGCYSGCPEPFPPHTVRSFPFSIDIKPSDYAEKIPVSITNLQKIIGDDTVTYLWDKPAYSGGPDDIVYIVRDGDGSVLAATTVRQLQITETTGSDPEIQIEASGEDGRSVPVASSLAQTTDLRTPPPAIEEVPDEIPSEPEPTILNNVTQVLEVEASLIASLTNQDTVLMTDEMTHGEVAGISDIQMDKPAATVVSETHKQGIQPGILIAGAVFAVTLVAATLGTQIIRKHH